MEHVNNFVIDDMYILIPWGKEHVTDEVFWSWRRIGMDSWVYVLDKWLNGGTMEVEIPGHVDISISRQVLARSKVKLELCKLSHCWILVVGKAHVLGEEKDFGFVEDR